jgi:hypothetical protein
MKKILKKSLVLALAVFLSVFLYAPAVLHAQPVLVSVTVTPEYGEIPALGQTTQYNAIAKYDDDSEVDVTDTATWDIDDPTIAANNGGGLFTGIKRGWAEITAEFDGITGYANLWVSRPEVDVSAGAPGDTTYINLWAYDCNGLPWELVVTKNGTGVMTASGTISSDDWNHSINTTLSEGDYTATYSIDGTVQHAKDFSIWGFYGSMKISVGYAGETTKFALNATNSSGKTGQFTLAKEDKEGYWDNIYVEDNISIDSDDWSYTINQTLAAGNYWAGFFIEDYWVDSFDFKVVKKGEPQPPVVKKSAPVKRGPSINEKPLSSYEQTTSGFTALFYNRFLRRPPEQEGLNAWIAWLESGEITGADLIQRFVFGEECQKIISEYTNEEFLTFLYKAIFNRKPDEDGYNIWLSRMADGMAKEEVVKQFGISDEFIALCNLFGIKPYPGYTGTGE